MRWWLVLAVLVVGASTAARSQDPLRPGFPPCRGGERGYWQSARVLASDGRELNYLALTSQDLLDPAYVICWVEPDQQLTAQAVPARAPGGI